MKENNQDHLADMFALQAELNARIGIDSTKLESEADRTEWVLNFSRAMQQELAELTDSVPWKWWAKYQTFDLQNARVEVIDLFHFLISLAQTLGLSPADVHRLYCEKHAVNHSRQDSGYHQKDESDNTSIGTTVGTDS